MKTRAHRVLLIEDDLFLLELYRQALAGVGYLVQAAQGAQEGLDLLDEYGADVVVLDLMLPAHGGIEALHELQSHSDWQAIPVIVLSSVPQSRLGHGNLAELNIQHYLYKPDTTPTDLLAKLETL